MIKKILGVALGVFVLLAAGAVPARADFIVNPTSLTFAVPPGQNPSAQLVFIQNTNGGVKFNLSVQSNGLWLTYGSVSSNTTPANFSVGANSSGLAVGIYTGSITITATTGSDAPVTINVTLVVANGPVMVPNPTALTFTETQIGVLPDPQTVAVSNPGPGTLTFTAAASDTWLSVSPTSGSAVSGSPATLTVSIKQNALLNGTYSGSITLSSSNSANTTATIGVTLTVPQGPVLAVSPSFLNFNATAGGPNPQAQPVFVNDAGIGALGFTVLAATTSGGSCGFAQGSCKTSPGGWLSVTPFFGHRAAHESDLRGCERQRLAGG